MTSFCCVPFWHWYVTLAEKPCLVCDGEWGCTEFWENIFCAPCKVTYCFCGKKPDDRQECCTKLFVDVDGFLHDVFCSPCSCIKQCQQHQLEVQEAQRSHELKVLELKNQQQLNELKLLQVKQTPTSEGMNRS